MLQMPIKTMLVITLQQVNGDGRAGWNFFRNIVIVRRQATSR